MDIKEAFKHVWSRLKHLNVLRAESKQSGESVARQETSELQLKHNNERDYQNTKPGEHIYTRRPNSRGSRTL